MCEDITDEEGKAPPGGGEGGDLGVLAYLCVCTVGWGKGLWPVGNESCLSLRYE